ncbi:MAG: DUF2569 domain-containing protein [Nitrospiraceae bacterium]
MSPSASSAGTEPGYRNIGGWLLFVALGLVLFPLWKAATMAEDLLPAFTIEAWSALTTPGSPAYHPLNARVLLFELIGNSLILVSSLFVAGNFFLKSRLLPRMMVVFLICALLFYLADYIVSGLLPAVASESGTEPLVDLGAALLVCAILVPYFLFSKRVKGTFKH